MRENDIASTRRAIGALARSKHLRRYPDHLRARLAELVAAHPEHSTASLARELDMAPATLQRMVAAVAPLVPVRVVGTGPRSAPRSNLIVRGPAGLVVEGLDLSAVAELIRALA